MTTSIPDILTALWDSFSDLPKGKDDLRRYTDRDVEMVQNLKHELDMLHDRLIVPRVTVDGPVHPEIMMEAVKQSYRERN